MKKHSILLGLALGVISFCSCSKIQDALTVKVPVDFTTDMQVMDSTAGLKSGYDYQFFASATINPSTNETLIKYKSKIKSITASGISFTPTGLSGDIKVTNAILYISNNRQTHPDGLLVRWYFRELTLKNGVKIDLTDPTGPLSAGSIEDISTMLDDDQDILIFWKGTQSIPVNPYNFSTTMKAEVTAYLLK